MNWKFASLLVIICLPLIVLAQQDTTSSVLVSIKPDPTGKKALVTVNGKAPDSLATNKTILLINTPAGKFVKFTVSPNGSTLQFKLGTNPVTTGIKTNGTTYTLDSSLVANGTSLLSKALFVTVSFPAPQTAGAPLTFFIQRPSTTTHRSTSSMAGNNTDTTRYLPGNLFYDAQKLPSLTLTAQDWDNIIRYYGIDTIKSHQDLIDDIDNWKNPFFKDVFSSGKLIPAAAGTGKTGASNAANTSIIGGLFGSGGIGGMDVTSLADGAAKFLVERAKQELTLAFFDKLDTLLHKKEFADLATLFPRTDSLLNQMGTQIYDYSRYIQNLTSAFKADLQALPADLPGIIPNHNAFFTKHPTWAASLKTASYLANGLENKTHPGDLIALFPLSNLDLVPDSTDLKAGFRILQILSASLKDTATGANADYWVSIGQMRSLVTNKPAFELFLGLIYQKMVNGDWQVKFSNSDSLSRIMDTVGVHYTAYYTAWSNFFLSLGVQTDALEKLIKSAAAATNDSAKLQLYASYARQTVMLFQTVDTVFTLPLIKQWFPNPAWLTKLNNYFAISYKVADLASDIGKKDYSGAINDAMNIYSDWIKQGPDTTVNKTYTTIAAYASLTSQLVKGAGDGITDSTLLKTLTAVLQTATAPVNNPPPPPPAKPVAKADPFQAYIDSLTQVYTAKVITPAVQAQLRDAFNKVTSDAAWQKKQLDSAKTLAAKQAKASADSITTLNAQSSNDVANGNSVRSKLIFWGGFIAGMATAKTSADVEQVLETYALPVGSSRIKRVSNWNVAVNGYIGPFLGWETIKGVDQKAATTVGITAPIGISASHGHSVLFIFGTGNAPFSSSIFVSIFDLGAITAFRIDSTGADKIPTVQLKDIVSPGFFYSQGFPNCPISFNFGWQAGPLLRNVSPTVNTYSNNYSRWSLSLLVDIPIFNLFTSHETSP